MQEASSECQEVIALSSLLSLVQLGEEYRSLPTLLGTTTRIRLPVPTPPMTVISGQLTTLASPLTPVILLETYGKTRQGRDTETTHIPTIRTIFAQVAGRANSI